MWARTHPAAAHLRLALDKAVFDNANRRNYLLPERGNAAVAFARINRGAGLRLRTESQLLRCSSQSAAAAVAGQAVHAAYAH